jgi:hypothetical protein
VLVPLVTIWVSMVDATPAHAATTQAVVATNPYFVPMFPDETTVIDALQNGGFAFPFAPDVNSVRVTTAPRAGTAIRTDVGLAYQPGGGPTRSDSFRYEICSASRRGVALCDLVTVYVEPITVSAPANASAKKPKHSPPGRQLTQYLRLTLLPAHGHGHGHGKGHEQGQGEGSSGSGTGANSGTEAADATAASGTGSAGNSGPTVLAFTGMQLLAALLALVALIEGVVIWSASRRRMEGSAR